MKISDCDLKKLGERMKEIRESLGLRQKELANAVGISVQRMSDFERGKSYPAFKVLYYLSSVCKVNLEYLIHGEGAVFKPDNPDKSVDLALERFWEDNPFGAYTGDVREVIDYMRRSRLALGAIISYAREYLFRNEALIEKDIKASEEKAGKREENGGNP